MEVGFCLFFQDAIGKGAAPALVKCIGHEPTIIGGCERLATFNSG